MATKANGAGKGAGSKPTYTKADKKNIGLLQNAGVELTGEETPEELETMVEEKGLGEQDDSQDIIPGVPNQIAVVHEPVAPGSKDKPFALHHVMKVEPKSGEKGKSYFAMYNHRGQRVSHVLEAGKKMPVEEGSTESVDELAYHRKAAVRANVMRKANRLPNDPD